MSEPAARLAVQGTIWAAALLYFAALCCRCVARKARAAPWYRRLWPLACAAYLLHVAAAFGLYHDWSHARAFAHAAHRTYETVGWYWGGGIYVNYAFTLLWFLEAALLAFFPRLHGRLPRLAYRLWLMATWFMFFQGMVVFGQRVSRALCVLGLAACGAAWLLRGRAQQRACA